MTIILVKAEIMVADGMTVAGGKTDRCTMLDPKIVRLPDGSLVGAAGGSQDCWQFAEWCRAGMPKGSLPEFEKSEDNKDANEIDWLWLKTDGTLWRGHKSLLPYPVPSPYTIGCSTACYMAEGAMLTGLSAEEAVRLILPHCRNIGEPIQVERLHPALWEAAE
jgi:hypothetical protein